ncbi:hypothetical protein M0R45_016669 [Rubus argutus]|uniref:Uncharacterized protein n=1 Tax=Rubus argutus TaxID=59490 RepID=A0AAW1XSL9_RUBAR
MEAAREHGREEQGAVDRFARPWQQRWLGLTAPGLMMGGAAASESSGIDAVVRRETPVGIGDGCRLRKTSEMIDATVKVSRDVGLYGDGIEGFYAGLIDSGEAGGFWR